MTYAVKTVENLFTWCGHESYQMMMEINQSFTFVTMKGNKCGNVL